MIGECYRTLGRLDDAKHHFKLEIALNPENYHAIYNLAYTYQQNFEWEKSIKLYRQVSENAVSDGTGIL